MPYKLRQAAQRDLPSIAQIYAPYVTGTAVTFEYEPPSAAEFAARYRAGAADFPWLVCEADGALAGYAYAHRAFERAAYQWNAELSVYLAPSHQKRGIAAQFYRTIEAFLRRQGYYTLYASITAANEASERFHAAAGFERFAVFRRCGYKCGAWHDVVWYQKQLREPAQLPAPPVPFSALPAETVSAALIEATRALQGSRSALR